MTTKDLIIVVLFIESVLYLPLIAVALRRNDFPKRARRALAFYLLFSCLWLLSQVSWQLGWLDFLRADDDLPSRIPRYGVLLLSLLFLHLSRSFLRLGETRRRWWGLGLGWIAALVALDANLVSLREVLWTGNGWIIQRAGVVAGLLVFGWGIFSVAAILLTIKTYHHTGQPLHRNRIKYWWPALAFTFTGQAVFLFGLAPLGGGLCLAGALCATFAMITHHLPDVRQTARRAAAYLLITLMTVAIYTAGFTTMQYLFQTVPGYSPLLSGAIIALILAILFQPLLGLAQRLVNRLVLGAGYDPGHTLRQYSTSISNILDLELLANVMVKLISEALGSRHGRLFLVDYERGAEKNGAFHFRDVGGTGDKETNLRSLSKDDPIADYLRREQHPLTQYDIDLLPSFQSSPSAERAWLSNLDVDVYVPIHAKGEWLGLLALGPKVSGDRYFDADLAMLSTLADQTAVALDNARLVEGLVRANNEIGHAYADLNKANRQLQELDKLKSAFIGVITHELRTPFANMAFSLELLERHGREHLPEELHEQLDQLTTGTQSAKTMIDNLVTFATFLSKQGELHPTQLDFSQVIQKGLQPLQTLAKAKQIALQAKVPEGLPPLQGDRERLVDAVYHLVHNAIKFTAAGGKIWVNCRAVDGTAHFEVRDTGVGISADKLPTLWEGFAQLADPLRRGVEGLGLGLALVKYVVNAHGGEVLAESQEGIGSTFGFHIPFAGA